MEATSKKLKQKKPTTSDKSTDPPRVILVYFRIRFNILEIQYYNRKIALGGRFFSLVTALSRYAFSE